MARAFVTGGGGFIGGELVAALLARGDRVVALARGDASADTLADRGADVVRGDVLDGAGALCDAMAGADVVHHVAGVNAHCPRDPAYLWRVNVLGPQNVVQAASRAGVGRVVLMSSAASIGEARGTIGSERSPHRGSYLSLYEQSKHVGERAALAAAAATGVPVVTLNPTSVQGPPRVGGTGAIIIAFLNRRLRAFVDTQVSIVDVRDVVDAHLRAEHSGRAGQRYVLSAAAISSAQALALIAELSGVRYRVPFVPAGLARGLAVGLETAFRAVGRRPPVCRVQVDTILHGHRYDGSLAQRELGVRYTPVADTLRRTIDWARAEGLAPASG
jgi:dihydroflavonol-4-reductase